jgi:hypothetical protein
MLRFIAVVCKIAPSSSNVDITTFYERIILQLRWRNLQF